MKVEVKKSGTTNELPFPKLMIAQGGLVVLFSCNSKGVALNETPLNDPGDHSDNWDMNRFTDFDGSITLSNK